MWLPPVGNQGIKPSNRENRRTSWFNFYHASAMRVSNGGSLDAALREVDAPCFALLLLHSVASGRDQCSQSSATQSNARYWVLLVSWRATSVQLSWEPAPALNQPNPPPKSRSARQWRVKTIYLFMGLNFFDPKPARLAHLLRDADLLQNGWIFRKVPKVRGGGSFSIQESMLQNLDL